MGSEMCIRDRVFLDLKETKALRSLALLAYIKFARRVFTHTHDGQARGSGQLANTFSQARCTGPGQGAPTHHRRLHGLPLSLELFVLDAASVDEGALDEGALGEGSLAEGVSEPLSALRP